MDQHQAGGLLELELHEELLRASDGAPPPGFDLADVVTVGRRRRRARHRRRAAGSAVAATAVGVLAVLVPMTGPTTGAGPADGTGVAVVDDPAEAARTRQEQMQPQRDELEAALSRYLGEAGVQVVGDLRMVPSDGIHDHLWQALVTVLAPDGQEVPLRVGTRAPGPAPVAVEGGPGVEDVGFADVDCASPTPFTWPVDELLPEAAPEPETVVLAECSVEQLPDGSTLTTTATPAAEEAALGPQDRQTVREWPDGTVVWVVNGGAGYGSEDEAPAMSTMQQRALVLDADLRLAD